MSVRGRRGPDRDEPTGGYILEQDREIADEFGRVPLAIKSISRVGAKKKWAVRLKLRWAF
jgi:hypothetical protein